MRLPPGMCADAQPRPSAGPARTGLLPLAAQCYDALGGRPAPGMWTESAGHGSKGQKRKRGRSSRAKPKHGAELGHRWLRAKAGFSGSTGSTRCRPLRFSVRTAPRISWEEGRRPRYDVFGTRPSSGSTLQHSSPRTGSMPSHAEASCPAPYCEGPSTRVPRFHLSQLVRGPLSTWISSRTSSGHGRASLSPPGRRAIVRSCRADDQRYVHVRRAPHLMEQLLGGGRAPRAGGPRPGMTSSTRSSLRCLSRRRLRAGMSSAGPPLRAGVSRSRPTD